MGIGGDGENNSKTSSRFLVSATGHMVILFPEIVSAQEKAICEWECECVYVCVFGGEKHRNVDFKFLTYKFFQCLQNIEMVMPIRYLSGAQERKNLTRYINLLIIGKYMVIERCQWMTLPTERYIALGDN